MQSKLSSVADYLDNRRKTSSSETSRLREVDVQENTTSTFGMNAGANYLNLKTSGVIVKQKKFSNYSLSEDEPVIGAPMGDPDADLDQELDLDSILAELESDQDAPEEALFGDGGAEFDKEDGLGLVSGVDSQEQYDEEFDPNMDLGGERYPGPASLPEGEYGNLAKEEPQESRRHNDYGWIGASRKEQWLKEAQSEGIFKDI